MEHIGTKTIETERLILRRFEPDDAEAMYRNWTSDPEVTKYLMWPTHESVEVSREVCADWAEKYSDPRYYQWAIVPKELGEPIGSIAAVHLEDSICMAHIGYCIGRKWWGQGITSEALAALIEFFFYEVGMNIITSRHDPRNPNSGRVMLKCGMIREGTIRGCDWNNQGVCGKVWYSITREEYEFIKKYRGSVRLVEDPEEKRRISRQVLEALPDWFAVQESREQYISASAELPLFAAIDNGRPIGFLCLKETGKHTVELAVMGVLKEYHRKGYGRALFFFARQYASARGYSFMQVKTVKKGMYEDYDATNDFYLSLGFKELEVFPLLWDEANPCQIYVMDV